MCFAHRGLLQHQKGTGPFTEAQARLPHGQLRSLAQRESARTTGAGDRPRRGHEARGRCSCDGHEATGCYRNPYQAGTTKHTGSSRAHTRAPEPTAGGAGPGPEGGPAQPRGCGGMARRSKKAPPVITAAEITTAPETTGMRCGSWRKSDLKLRRGKGQPSSSQRLCGWAGCPPHGSAFF